MMEFIKYTIIIIITFIFQSWSSEFFTLGTIDPDFCVIVLLYISIKNDGVDKKKLPVPVPIVTP